VARRLGSRNPRLARLRHLSRRRRRRVEDGAFVIEGPTLVLEALESGITLEEVFVASDVLAGDAASVRAVEAVRAAGVPRWDVDAGVLATAVDVVTPRPIVAVARIPEGSAPLHEADLVLVLDAIADPGNAGTLVRLAEASGVGVVAFGGDAVDPYGPKCVRASAGSVFRVPVAQGPTARLLDQLRAAGHQVWLTEASGATVYDQVDFTGPTAFVLGNEAHGVPDQLRAHATGSVSLPMEGHVESLNVAVAGSILCFEAARQRRAARAGRGEPDGLVG
jgi:TrmH family RNA methyltransferase